jgi:predicted amidohydrolase YtcJ
MAGTTVRLRGYLAPSLVSRPTRVLLSEASPAPCLLCGSVHGPGASLFVTPRDAVAVDIAMHEAVDVSGRLEIGAAGEAGLVDAVVERAAAAPASTLNRWRPSRRPAPPRRAARPATAVGAGAADIILRNGRIHTVDSAARTVDSVAIRDGRFIAVGSAAEVARHAGPDTEVLDLAGRTVVPGLIDSHVHQFYVALNVPTVRLLDSRSIADVQRAIGARAAATPPGEWVVGSSGWHESLLAEGRMPTRWELDEVSPDNPVIIPRGGHVVTVNSRALERAGITRETPDPTGGVIVRDPATGEATGVLLETAAYFARRVAPPLPSPEEMARLVKEAMRELNGFGIVGAVDPVIDESGIAVYRRLRDAGEITVRTDLLYYARDRAETEKGIAAMAAEDGDDMLRFAGIKFMLDGGVEGARLREPYRIVPGEQPRPDYHGLLMTPPGGEEEFVDALRLVAEAGLQAQTHGVGDEAIDLIVRAYERVNRDVPVRDLRWVLMHVFLPTEAALAKMTEIGVLATVQDHPVLLGHNKRRWWGDERAAAAIPIRKLIDVGLTVGGGSDGPVVPVDPFLSMWWMVTRRTLKGYALGPEHAISAREALDLYTVNNARILGVEDERGSIEPGKLADLAVLSQDILAIAPDDIRNTIALLTMVGGKVVHRAGM